jgi:hypothetical protein
VRLTAKGQRLERTVNPQAEAAEARIPEMHGPRRFGHMRNTLQELADRVIQDNGPSQMPGFRPG